MAIKKILIFVTLLVAVGAVRLTDDDDYDFYKDDSQLDSSISNLANNPISLSHSADPAAKAGSMQDNQKSDD